MSAPKMSARIAQSEGSTEEVSLPELHPALLVQRVAVLDGRLDHGAVVVHTRLVLQTLPVASNQEGSIKLLK